MLAAMLAAVSFAQTPASRTVGTVTAADAAARTLTVKADDGAETKVKVADNARISQIPPGETSLQNAKPAELQAVSTGDRVLAVGQLADGVLTANRVVLMSKTDLAKKQQEEQMAWNTRGITGVVTAVDKAAGTIKVNYRSPEGTKPILVSLNEKATVRRYAPTSTKYADSKPSTLADVEVGDQIRALGTKSEDGASYKADQMLSGGFRNVAATVNSIDAAKGMMVITDLDTKKKIEITIQPDALLKTMPEMAARMLAMAAQNGGQMPGGMGGGMRGPAGQGGPGGAPGGAPGGGNAAMPGGRPAGAPGGGAPGGGAPGGMMGAPGGMAGGPRRGGGDMMANMIERMPALKLTDLKNGEPLILMIGKTADPTKAYALTVIAGVEPILATPANNRSSVLGNWDLSGGGGLGGGTP